MALRKVKSFETYKIDDRLVRVVNYDTEHESNDGIIARHESATIRVTAYGGTEPRIEVEQTLTLTQPVQDSLSAGLWAKAAMEQAMRRERGRVLMGNPVGLE